MFKKYFILIALAIAYTMPVMADGIVLVPITTDPPQGQLPRSPILVPEFYLDGYTLTAGSYTVGSAVELLDENDNVVFTS